MLLNVDPSAFKHTSPLFTKGDGCFTSDFASAQGSSDFKRLLKRKEDLIRVTDIFDKEDVRDVSVQEFTQESVQYQKNSIVLKEFNLLKKNLMNIIQIEKNQDKV